jgi:hypothetical protein
VVKEIKRVFDENMSQAHRTFEKDVEEIKSLLGL